MPRSGNPNGNPKLKPEHVLFIAHVYRTDGWAEAVRLHKEYGVAPSTIEKLIQGVNWSHITGIPKPEREEVLV